MKFIWFSLAFVFLGCNDTGEVFIYDKNVKKLSCLSLLVFPPNKMIVSILKKRYTFSDSCKNELIVSYKNSITCNSNQNADKKIKGLPQSYFRLEIKRENTLVYTYYKDLPDNIKSEDVTDGFKRVEKDLL